MPFFERIGYIVILYWTCRLFNLIITKIYKTYQHSSKTNIDLPSLGKWGIVTGCSQGIGMAYAEALAKLGLNIVLISSGKNHLQNLANAIESVYEVKTKIIELNFSNGMEAYKLIERETVGLEVGILVNNFGMFYPHPEYFLDLPHKEKIYMKIIQCNVVVVTNMCQIILPQMVTRGKGVIVNVASSSAIMPSPLMTVFAASKAYVLKFSRDLNIEYNKYGIIIQCLLPGCITNSSKSSQTGWMVPTPDKYVQSAIKMIGKEDVTTGFFPHKIFVGAVKAMYRLSPSLVNIGMTRIMEGNRNRAVRRYMENI